MNVYEILYICTLALEADLVLGNRRLFTEEEESAKDEATRNMLREIDRLAES